MNIEDLKELQDLSAEERAAVMSILEEYSSTGESKLFNDIKYIDFDEVPVDITTFIHDRKYLGNALYDAEGRYTIFPYWEEKLRDIFPDNISTRYNTVIFTGAIGLGKSTIAVICLLYLLYRLLCLKDPYLYYGMQPIDKISISLMNITIENAKGVALDKMNQMLLSSEWFMSHGEMRGETNLTYIPSKHIELITASSNNQVIGRCLDGDTEILTNEGIRTLKDLVDKTIKVISIDEQGNRCLSDECTVKPTILTDEEYQIELEDGSVIKCTPNHKFMLKDGTYKEAKDLTEEDELFDENVTYKEFIQNIINTRGQWNISDDEYYEVHHIIPKCLGGEGVIQKRNKNKSNRHPNLIYLYPYEHFIAHKLLALEHPDNRKLVFAWSKMAFPKGKTKRDFEITPEEYSQLREMQSKVLLGTHLSEESKQKLRDFNTGRHPSEESRKKMSAAQRGKVVSEETKQKLREINLKRYKEHPETFIGRKKDKVCINNGEIRYYIDKGSELPEGFVYGQGKHKSYSIKDIDSFKKQKSELTKGEKNPMYGHGDKVSGGNNGHAIYIYTYKEIDYQSRKELLEVLKKEYTDISTSTIRKIIRNDYTDKIGVKYRELIANLTWRLKDKYENKIN